MLRRRQTDPHRSAIRLSLFDAILLAPVIVLPLLIVVALALFSMEIGRASCRERV